MWFLTVVPLVRISVFIAKLSERQYCRRVLEDFHSQEYIQFFDIQCGLFMRLHFSIGCYDYRRSTRLRQRIHFSIVQVLLGIMCIDAPESTTNYRSSGLRFDAFRHLFPKVRRMFLYFSPLILGYFWPGSTLLRGHIALATLSPPETDPQILEHWGYADEIHLRKSFRAKDFGLECQRDVQRLSCILHIGLVSVCLNSSAKSMKTSAAPYPEIRNPIVLYLMSKHS